jgi:hypothetical protein
VSNGIASNAKIAKIARSEKQSFRLIKADG